MRKGRLYDAPEAIAPGADVIYRQLDARRDLYRGTAPALAAAGLLPLRLFPGAAGMPKGTVTFRSRVDHDEWPGHAPGYMQVYRKLDEQFEILLNVSAEERKRREAARQRVETAIEEGLEQPKEPEWPFPGIDRDRFYRLRPNQQVEIQGLVRQRIECFEEDPPGEATKRGGRVNVGARIYPRPSTSPIETTTPRSGAGARIYRFPVAARR